MLKPGYLADDNVIDMEKIKFGRPWLDLGLLAGGKPLLQNAEGYDYPNKSDVLILNEGVATCEYPGSLIRGRSR